MNNNEEILDSKIDDLYMVFVINNQKYALSSKYITEIIEILPITKVHEGYNQLKKYNYTCNGRKNEVWHGTY